MPKHIVEHDMKFVLSTAVDVSIAKGGRLAGAGHELVKGVDALHLFHDTCGTIRKERQRMTMAILTEGEVSRYPGSGLHEVNGISEKGVSLGLGALRSIGKALVTKA